MKNLKLPKVWNLRLWLKIAKNKRKLPINFNDLKKLIANRYNEYNNNIYNLECLSKQVFNDDDKLFLQSFYNNNAEFKKIRKQIFEIQYDIYHNKCPYCLIGQQETLDHYLEKDNYPEYSVYIPNLIPCCYKCNNKKSEHCIVDNERQFINFYYDNIPFEKFLFIDIAIDSDNIPKAEIYLHFNQDNNVTNLIKRHFDNLDLLNKYKNNITEKLSSIIMVIKNFNQSHELTLKMLNSIYETLQTQYGNNYWETCLYYGIIQNKEFIRQYCNQIN